MARRVFFSFHYERDIMRVNVVRNSGIVRPSNGAAGFFDSSLWEEAKKKHPAAITKMIDDALDGTTVTCVLVGAETNSREYVQYEIERSKQIGNGLLAVKIHTVPAPGSPRDVEGYSPFGFFSPYSTYDWVSENGYENFGRWVEDAYQRSDKARRDRAIAKRTSGSSW